jgi:hypothetical protein
MAKNNLVDYLITEEDKAFKEIEAIRVSLAQAFKSFKLLKLDEKGEAKKIKELDIKELEDIIHIGVALELEDKPLAFVLYNSVYYKLDKYKELRDRLELVLDDSLIKLEGGLN